MRQITPHKQKVANVVVGNSDTEDEEEGDDGESDDDEGIMIEEKHASK